MFHVWFCLLHLLQGESGQRIPGFIHSRPGYRSSLKRKNLPQEGKSEAGTKIIWEDELFQNTKLFQQMAFVGERLAN